MRIGKLIIDRFPVWHWKPRGYWRGDRRGVPVAPIWFSLLFIGPFTISWDHRSCRGLRQDGVHEGVHEGVSPGQEEKEAQAEG